MLGMNGTLRRAIVALGALTALSALAQQPGRGFLLVNAGGVEPAVLEDVRVFCETQLRHPLRAEGAERQTLDLRDAVVAFADRTNDENVAVIVLTDTPPEENEHMVFSTQRMVTAVNVRALTDDDAKRTAWRLQRMVMRAAARMVGIPPAPDPHCTTRDYRSLEDLDSMGRNFCPPWQDRYHQQVQALELADLFADVRPLSKEGWKAKDAAGAP